MEFDMRIEVATPPNVSAKEKGDLLEQFASDFLKMQNYEVDTEVRVTASELDLLCKHRVNQKVIYVECKAHRKTLDANVLKNLLGTITFKDYQEGWLISTGPLGKEAKGFQHDWENKPTEQSQRLSIYTPNRIIEAFTNAHLIRHLPHDSAVKKIGEDSLGDWVLLITSYGRYWIATCLSGGVPEGVLVYSAKTAQLITDAKLLKNLAKTDTSLNTLDFEYISNIGDPLTNPKTFSNLKPVVEVQHGDSWSDYRPARPKDFVGRQEVQTKIIHFLEDVKKQNTRTRVFAITGNSGMGKSSLIAKLRDRVRNKRYRQSLFIYAVDIRAATDASYVQSSLLSCLYQAAKNGFGYDDANALKISNLSEPLESPSIKKFLTALEQKKQVVCLVFDQFEELYSKSELFDVFEASQRLFLSIISARSNLVLGFAWKSDSTVQQNHPAYFMWHNLADYRMQVELGRFKHSEASQAITLFEKELGEKLQSRLRRQLIENSQGYPWLLKKWSILIYELIQAGASQFELMDKALDVELLFRKDLQNLSQAERICLNLIAQNAPADWFEMLEASGQDILRALLDKRLVVRSGDRLNLYWDIFREFVLTNKVPLIPLTYLPAYPSLKTTLMMAQQLDSTVPRSYAELSKIANLKENSVANVIRDLIMFGVATGGQSHVKLAEGMTDSSPKQVLRKLRDVLKHHALTMNLSKLEESTSITEADIIDLLKKINPAAQHREPTWKVYADRMGQWLSATGYIVPTREGWKVEDQSDVNSEFAKVSIGHYKQEGFFVGSTSPAKTVEALEWFMSRPPQLWSEFEAAGYKNAAIVLRNLQIINNVGGKYLLTEPYQKKKSSVEIVWNAASKETVLVKVIEFLRNHPLANGDTIGQFVNDEYGRNWSPASKRRVGNSLKKWAQWIILGIDSNSIPEPLGPRSKSKIRKIDQPSLF